MTPQTLSEACGIPMIRAQQWADPIAEALNLGKCRTPEQIACALATWGHESAGFTIFSESFNYSAESLVKQWPRWFSPELAQEVGRTKDHKADQPRIAMIAYGDRAKDLGNIRPLDGWTYRARSMGQITGRRNYAILGQRLGEPYESQPDKLLEPVHGARASGEFWSMNDLASYGGDILSASRVYNRGTAKTTRMPIGWPDRERRYKLALSVLTRDETPGEAVRRMMG